MAETTSAHVNEYLTRILAGANLVPTIPARFPWQQSGAEAVTTNKFFLKTFALPELGGLVQQCRQAAFANIVTLECRVRKIAGADVTWRVFVAADGDLDPQSFNETSLVEYIHSHPGAIPQFTLDKDTTQSTLIFPIANIGVPVASPDYRSWPIGVGTSVNYNLPPARPPLLIIYAEASSSIKDKLATWTWSGVVEVSHHGYVAPLVSRATP